jgi:hypothetical protein
MLAAGEPARAEAWPAVAAQADSEAEQGAAAEWEAAPEAVDQGDLGDQGVAAGGPACVEGGPTGRAGRTPRPSETLAATRGTYTPAT